MNKFAKSALALGLISAVSFPALAAGTDGGALYLAEQLNHTDAEIVYMDFRKKIPAHP